MFYVCLVGIFRALVIKFIADKHIYLNDVVEAKLCVFLYQLSCNVSFVIALQKLRGAQISLVALALFRQVTCRYKSPDPNVRPSQQVRHI